MGLDALRRADDQDGQIHDAEGALGLAGEVRMPGGIDQSQGSLFPGEAGFLGKDGDAPFLFHAVGIQKGIPVVHTALFAHGAAEVQHGFGQGGLAGVHMGGQADGQGCCHCCILLCWFT